MEKLQDVIIHLVQMRIQLVPIKNVATMITTLKIMSVKCFFLDVELMVKDASIHL